MDLLKQQKMKQKKQEGGFLVILLAPLAASLLQSVISSVINDISVIWVRNAGRRYMNKNV